MAKGRCRGSQVAFEKSKNMTIRSFSVVDNRQKYFDQIYCYLKASGDPSSAMYVAMFQKDDAINFEDCERQLVTTKDEIEAIIDVTNFLRAMNGEPPLDIDESEEARRSLASTDLDQSRKLALRPQ